MRRSVRPVLVLVLSGLLALAAPVTALAVTQPPGAATAAHPPVAAVPADTDDFTFPSWHSDYTVGLTDEGYSSLLTTETIVATFPETDQNRGIRRLIPTHYRDQPTSPQIESVTDAAGTPLDYETDEVEDDDDADFLEVVIADDDFVHGDQTYVISYRQTHVILYPDNADDEELYWVVNGTGWAQPFGTVSATVRVADELLPRLTGSTACYQGDADSSTPCGTLTGPDTDGVVQAQAVDLAAHQGLTVVVGFEDGTFVPRDDSFTANPFPALALAAALASLALFALGLILRVTRWGPAPGRPTIVPEYLPPKGVNLLQVSGVLGGRAPSRAMTAQFLQFAVRGNVLVLEAEGKDHYLLELKSRDGLDPTEQAILTALFPAGEPIGTVRDLKTKDTTLGTALHKVQSAERKRQLTAGLREKKGTAVRPWLIGLANLTGALSVVFAVIALSTEVAGAWPALFLVVGMLAGFATIAIAVDVRPLTKAGAELRDYVKGVTVYIGLAEADRLRVLQSPTGALRTRADSGQVLKLYERLLPIAVLTGQEKEWSTVLGEYYTSSGEQPGWYAGTAPFNAVYFASAVSGFSTATTASWSGTAASSSSSGGGGGGSVGGGGGGGGGGGV